MNEFDENESLSSEERYDGFGGRRRGRVSVDEGDAGGISVPRYNLILGAVLLWGFLANALICFFTRNISLVDYALPILIGYIVLAFIGFLLTRSHSAAVSFIGYNFVVIPLGFVLSLYISEFEPMLVASVFFQTAAVTLSMMLLSMIFPRLFLSMGRALGITLLIVIVVELIATIVMMATGAFSDNFFLLIDWIVVVAFCGYIGYDWAIAQRRRRTVDAAVDSAYALYLDIVNLFIRLLAIAGRRSRK
ncbi:MAG: US12 family protein [Clostridia bacterium]|nr:US12 family protein [Clostridia bacterium]